MKEKKFIKIPKVFQHDLAVLNEGVGSRNQKEYCTCDTCIQLRKRRDSIFRKPKHKFARYMSKNF